MQDCWREGPVLLSCAEHCAVLYDNRVFSVAPDGPCFLQPRRPFVKRFITFPVSILLEFNAAQRPAVTRGATFCHAALQGFSTDSCGMTLPFHGESHLFTLNCCCATFKFWDAWSCLWKTSCFPRHELYMRSKFGWTFAYVTYICNIIQSQLLLHTVWLFSFRSVPSSVHTHAPASPGHPDDHPGQRYQCGHSHFPAVPSQI